MGGTWYHDGNLLEIIDEKGDTLIYGKSKVNPVNNMSQCWMLVEKMKKDKYEYKLEFSYPGQYTFNVSCSRSFSPRKRGWHRGEGGFSDAQAIILACALAKGVVNNG